VRGELEKREIVKIWREEKRKGKENSPFVGEREEVLMRSRGI